MYIYIESYNIISSHQGWPSTSFAWLPVRYQWQCHRHFHQWQCCLPEGPGLDFQGMGGITVQHPKKKTPNIGKCEVILSWEKVNMWWIMINLTISCLRLYCDHHFSPLQTYADAGRDPIQSANLIMNNKCVIYYIYIHIYIYTYICHIIISPWDG